MARLHSVGRRIPRSRCCSRPSVMRLTSRTISWLLSRQLMKLLASRYLNCPLLRPLPASLSSIILRSRPSLPRPMRASGPSSASARAPLGTTSCFWVSAINTSISSIDGLNMSTLSSVLQHQPFPPQPPNIPSCGKQDGLKGTKYDNNPCFVRDFIQTTNNIDLQVHQYTIYLTYGITRHLDFSAAIPFVDARMSVQSNTTIVPNSVAPPSASFPGNVFHQFNR